jgi:TonB family protein
VPPPLDPPPPKKDTPIAPVVPVRVGNGIAEPQKTAHVDPVYPPDALSARVDGVVMAEITIDPAGVVRDARVRRSIPQLDQAALTAIRQWRYRPTVKDGVPVPVLMTVSVPFKLPELPANAPGNGKTTTASAERPGTNTEKPARPDGPGPTVTEEAKPALEKPVSPPTPPPAKVDEGAAIRQADLNSMRALTNRFGAAYQNQDSAALRSAWPGISRNTEESYRSTFRSYRRLGWTLKNCTPSFEGPDRAIEICNVEVALTDLRGGATRTEPRTYRFSFERRTTGWTLVNVENLTGAR